MYKIYINNIQLILCDSEGFMRLIEKLDRFQFLKFKDSDLFKDNIALWESSTETRTICIKGDSLKILFNAFCSNYKIHPAGGGLVLNPDKELLMIYRLGKWDLPKGHQEKGEIIEETALREVEEECGITKLKLGKAVNQKLKQKNITYHTYISKKGKRILKQTFWYEMFYNQNETLVPQTEEDIEKVEWITQEQFPAVFQNSYPSVIDIISTYFKIEKS